MAWYGLHEVYYDDNGRPEGWTDVPDIIGDDVAEMRRQLRMMARDCRRSRYDILDYEVQS